MATLQSINLFSRAFRAVSDGFTAARRSLTSDSTLAQLGGGSGYSGFQAAKQSRMSVDWPSASRSADQDLQVDLRKLRARARDQAINSPIASRFLGMVRANVAGRHGVKLAFKVAQVRKSKQSNGLDEKANEELKRAWREWGKKGSCTVCGRYSWREVQRLITENTGRDGEQLIRKVYVPKTVNPFGFQIQLIDADQLDDNYNLMGRADGVQIRMGVEVDANQKALAYHLFQGNPYEASFGSSNRVRVPADQIIHWIVAHRTGQTRGYPWMASGMGQLRMLDGYFGAELAAARIGASILMSIETAKDADPDADEIEGDGINADGSKAIDIGMGSALDLTGTGATLNNHTPTHPTNAFDPFVKQSGRLIASGFNVPYHSLFNDLSGVNYSSARIGEMEVREFWMEMQTSFIDNVTEPVYDAWLGAALLNQAIALPFADRKRFCGEFIKWEPRRWPWIDPLKDVQANTLLVQNGFDTHESILNSVGRDLEETYTELSREQKLADELGIALGTDIRGQGTSEINNEDETPEDAAGGGSENAPKEDEEKPASQSTSKPAKPKAGSKPAPAKPKVKPGRSRTGVPGDGSMSQGWLKRGMHPANAALWNLTKDEE